MEKAFLHLVKSYGGNATIPGFEHNHTLRHSMTNVFGDPIPASNTMANTKYTQVFDIPVPATVSDSSKMSIVVMIVDANNRVLNVNGAKVGADADFQAN